jgi:small-conductance mechanosensitive channel
VFAKRVIGVLFEERDAFSRHQRTVSYHVVQLVLYLFAIVASVAVWGIDLGDILLGAGFLSVVVGLAARQTLASVLAGFVLLFGRPFDIGDWVAVDGQEGIVTDVSIFNTELRTFNGEYLVLPNDVVTAETLINRSRRGRLRVDVEVGVDYDADLDRARELAVEAVEGLETDDIRDYPEPVAVYTEFGDSAVVLEVRFWIDDPTAARRWNSRTVVIGAVKTAFAEAGITIPFPQRTLGGRGGRDENVPSVPTSEDGGERS